jgi:hypothetical protein
MTGGTVLLRLLLRLLLRAARSGRLSARANPCLLAKPLEQLSSQAEALLWRRICASLRLIALAQLLHLLLTPLLPLLSDICNYRGRPLLQLLAPLLLRAY